MSTIAVRYIVEIEGPSGPLNPAQTAITFDPTSAMTPAQQTATVISYIAKAMAGCSVESLLNSVTRHEISNAGVVGPGVTMALPTAELADWHTIDSDSPTPSSWSFVVGQGTGLATVGSSANVAEGTPAGGRSNGRHFLPWVRAARVNSSGLMNNLAQADVADAAAWRLLGTLYTQPAWWDAAWCVVNSKPTWSTQGVQTAVLRAAPARLRSRVR